MPERETMKIHRKVLVTRSADFVIRSESARYAAMGRECIGSLVGEIHNDFVVITHAGKTGNGAQLSYANAISDSSYQNRFVSLVVNHYPESPINWKGFYHSHPMGFADLSSNDMRTFETILDDPDYNGLNNLFVMLLSYKTDDNCWKIKAYIGVMLDGQFHRHEAKYTVIENEHPFVSELLGNEYSPFNEDTRELPPVVPAPAMQESRSRLFNRGFYIVHLKFMLQKEIDKISRNSVLVGNIIKESPWEVEFTNCGGKIRKVLFVIPDEYPLNPPSVVIYFKKKEKEFISSQYMNWNTYIGSMESILEIISRVYRVQFEDKKNEGNTENMAQKLCRLMFTDPREFITRRRAAR